MSVPGPHIADIRRDYRMASLDEQTAGDDPLQLFTSWFSEAQKAEIEEVNAMALATADAAGKPHARIVLLKGLDEKGFTFYTNYDSAKGHDMSANPQVAAVFFWKELERQVRIEGHIEKVSAGESDTYFHSRPRESQLGAWASPQSQTIPNREILDENFRNKAAEYEGMIPRPEHWGGYRIIPTSIEFWQGRSNRMHDRIVFEKESGQWSKKRLAP